MKGQDMGAMRRGRLGDGKVEVWENERWKRYALKKKKKLIASCAGEGQDMEETRRGRNGDARAEQWKDGKWESLAV